MPNTKDAYLEQATRLSNLTDPQLEEKLAVAMAALSEETGAASSFEHPRHEGVTQMGFEDDALARVRGTVRWLEVRLHHLLCQDKAVVSEADRQNLMRSLGADEIGRGAALAYLLSAYLWVPPAFAPAIGIYLARRIVQPTIEKACEAWGNTLKT